MNLRGFDKLSPNGLGMVMSKAGWQTKPLGNLCDVLDSQRKPITKSHRVAGEYPYYGATGILDFVEGYIFDEPLVLVGEDGAKWASGENTAFAIEGKCWVNNHAHVLRPHRSEITDNWLIHFLVHSDLSEFVSGLTVPKLNQGSLKEICIPVPPLPEQQRIVTILDQAFDGIATAKANAEQNLQNARALFESHLQSVFTQRGEGWEKKPLTAVCEAIFAGGDVPKGNSSKTETDKYRIPIFTNGEKNKGLYGYTDTARVTEPSITISARGTIGYSEIRKESYYPAIRLIVVIPKKEILDLSFLYYAIESTDIGHSGTSIPQLTVPMVSGFTIPVPPIAEQQMIVERIDALREETQRLESLYQRKLAALDELKKSLLNQAFSGAL